MPIAEGRGALAEIPEGNFATLAVPPLARGNFVFLFLAVAAVQMLFHQCLEALVLMTAGEAVGIDIFAQTFNLLVDNVLEGAVNFFFGFYAEAVFKLGNKFRKGRNCSPGRKRNRNSLESGTLGFLLARRSG